MRDAVLDRARSLNQTCFCITLDRDALARALNSAAGAAEFYEREIATRATFRETRQREMSETQRRIRSGAPLV